MCRSFFLIEKIEKLDLELERPCILLYYRRHKCRAIFEISARWLNITIDHILCQSGLTNVTVQTVYRIVSYVTIQKTICIIEWEYIVTFNRLARIPNVALLVRPMVHHDVNGCFHIANISTWWSNDLNYCMDVHIAKIKPTSSELWSSSENLEKCK